MANIYLYKAHCTHGRLQLLTMSIIQGDKMCLRALNNGLLVLNPAVEYFVYTVDDLAILFVDK